MATITGKPDFLSELGVNTQKAPLVQKPSTVGVALPKGYLASSVDNCFAVVKAFFKLKVNALVYDLGISATSCLAYRIGTDKLPGVFSYFLGDLQTAACNTAQGEFKILLPIVLGAAAIAGVRTGYKWYKG